MYAFEYEVVLDDSSTKTDEVWNTIVLSHTSDWDLAKLQAVQGATLWVENLAKTLEGTSRSIRAYSGHGPESQRSRAYRCHVRVACVAHLKVNDDHKLYLQTEQRGGELVQTVWVPVKASV